MLEGRRDKGALTGGIRLAPGRFRPELSRRQPALVHRQRAVGQSQRLLRHQAFAAPIAVARIGGVEQLQHLRVPATLGMIAEVQTAPARGELLIVLERRTAQRRIKLPRQPQHAVANHLGLHSPRDKPPIPPVVGIPPRVRAAHCS